jgi:hypothetical protein
VLECGGKPPVESKWKVQLTSWVDNGIDDFFLCPWLYTNGMMYKDNNIYPFLFTPIIFFSYLMWCTSIGL